MGLADKHSQVVDSFSRVDGAHEFFNDFVALMQGWEKAGKLSEFKAGQRSSADLIKLFFARSNVDRNFITPTKIEDVYNSLGGDNA